MRDTVAAVTWGSVRQRRAHRERREASLAGAGVRPPYGATAAILLGSVVVSQAIPLAKRAFGGNVPPLFARLSPSIGPGILVVVALIVLATAAWHRLLRAPTWAFLVLTVTFGWVFAVALAAQSGGLDSVSAPLRGELDYFANVPLVEQLGPRQFAERYPELTAELSLHAATHPPGAPLVLWAVSRVVGGDLLAVSILVAL
ncbi:MAG TPA: hypothetical protein VEM93_01150, partial [Actinomycetota bacterium]|nr:hypothetical protein [Actinomycetota bacterium]